MRTFRVLTAALLVLPAAAAISAPAVAGPPPSYTAVTGSNDPITGDGRPFVDDVATDASNATAGQLVFNAASSSTRSALVVTVVAPAGGFVSGTTYTDGGTAGLSFTDAGTGCLGATWTLRVDDVAATSGTITSFTAHYGYDCNGNASDGDLRYASTTGYAIVLQSQATWDFGTQLVKRSGWAKSFSFTNRGTAAQSFAAISTGTPVFKITHSSCSTVSPLAVGASCTVTVAPDPTSTIAPVNANLGLTPSGGGADAVDTEVQLRVLGSDFATFWADAGPQRVSVHWGQLPGPFNAYAGFATLYRSTSKSTSTMKAIRTTSANDFVDYPAAGHIYYYSIRPWLLGGKPGDFSPIIAALPWPKYSAGTYHRLPAPVRFVSSHRVSAGHPYSLRVLGVHGVPSSHVSAVALNVTAAGSSATTQVYVYPSGTKRPAAPDVAVRAHDTRNDFVLAKVGSHGKVTISTAHGSVPITVDVFGYFAGSGLSSKYGMGGAPHVYADPATLVDTKGWHWGPLPSKYFVSAVADFFGTDVTPHVTSLIVEVTAYGSKGSGTITGFATNHRPNQTSVLSYRPGATTSTVAIVRSGLFYDQNSGINYPSVSLLNRGSKPVQMVVTVLGYVDDNTIPFGQRYVPTAPVHLLGTTLSSGSNRTINLGRHADFWTAGLNTKLLATRPSRSTTITLRGLGLGNAPAHGQLHAAAHVTTASATFPSAGSTNRIGVHNSAGRVRVDVWSFGRFEFYPLPLSTKSYAAETVPARSLAGAGRSRAGRMLPLA